MKPDETQTLTLADGRRLTYLDGGDPEGRPLVFCHPNPSCRLEAVPLVERASSRGFRVIAPDRPGFGGSDSAPGRTLLTWADDLTQLADALGLPQLTLLGISAGCPYALAFAHARPQRVRGVGVVSCGGPFDAPGAREGMSGTFRMVFFLAKRLPWAMRVLYRQQLALARRSPTQYVAQVAKSMSGADREALDALTEAERARLVGLLLEAMRQGPQGSVDDMRIVSAPWDFPAHDVRVPVQLWHGEDDANAPVAMGRWLAQTLPRCEAHFLAGEGHTSLALRHMDEILEALSGLGGAAEADGQRPE